MLGFSFFKQRKPREFSYKPIYHSPEQDEIERKRRMRNLQQGVETTAPKVEKYVPGSLIRDVRRERMVGTPVKLSVDSNEARNRLILRSVIFLILLVCIGVMIMNSEIFEVVFSAFMQQQ